MKIKLEKLFFSYVVRGRREGFLLPFTVFVVVLVLILGGVYFSSTVQTKNVLRVFYHHDYSRLIAESVTAEFRSLFQSLLQTNADLRDLIENPFEGKKVRLPMHLFPKSSALAKGFAMFGKPNFSCELTLKDLDDKLKEGSVAVKFGNEYQATLRVEIAVSLFQKKDQAKESRFFFEYDLKHFCLRSSSQRNGKGYSSNAINDFVLFVRDAENEFNQTEGESLNSKDYPLTIVQTGGVDKTGKIFFGCGRYKDPKKFVFINISNEWQNKLKIIPNPPSPIEVSWTNIKKYMPTTAQELVDVFRTIEKEASKNGFDLKLDENKIKGVFSFEYHPVSGDQAWESDFRTRYGTLYDRFKQSISRSHEKHLRKELNFYDGLKLFGPSDNDFWISEELYGNIRQRFWQTVTFKLDLSDITDNQQIKDAIKQNPKCKAIPINIEYFSPSELENIKSQNNQTKELYDLVDFVQKSQVPELKLMSQPISIYALRSNESFENREPVGKLPEFFGPNKGPMSFIDYLPFSSYLLRSHIFHTSDDLYNSGFYDEKKNVLTVRGLIGISKGPLIIKKDMKFRGAGVLVSYSPGGIIIEGAFLRENPNVDGPCILFTYTGNIIANKIAQGKIEASLIALNFQYAQGRTSCVDFSGKKAEVFGNLIVDRLNRSSMAHISSLQPGESNVITYDSKNLSPQDVYVTTLGARLRNMNFYVKDADGS